MSAILNVSFWRQVRFWNGTGLVTNKPGCILWQRQGLTPMSMSQTFIRTVWIQAQQRNNTALAIADATAEASASSSGLTQFA